MKVEQIWVLNDSPRINEEVIESLFSILSSTFLRASIFSLKFISHVYILRSLMASILVILILLAVATLVLSLSFKENMMKSCCQGNQKIIYPRPTNVKTPKYCHSKAPPATKAKRPTRALQTNMPSCSKRFTPFVQILISLPGEIFVKASDDNLVILA